MIQKVLIAEDHQIANISLQKTLTELGITDIDVVDYCDDAFQKIEKSHRNGNSFDLLITDLHFETDHRVQKIAGGMALVDEVRKVQPDLKILVFSAEGNPGIINLLFSKHEIDGYVRKARRDAEELKDAITQIAENKKYIPAHFTSAIRKQNAYQFTEYDVTLISLLASGMAQKNIPFYLEENNISPSGLSSVEKRLKNIRSALKKETNQQLVLFCREIGII